MNPSPAYGTLRCAWFRWYCAARWLRFIRIDNRVGCRRDTASWNRALDRHHQLCVPIIGIGEHTFNRVPIPGSTRSLEKGSIFDCWQWVLTNIAALSDTRRKKSDMTGLTAFMPAHGITMIRVPMAALGLYRCGVQGIVYVVSGNYETIIWPMYQW